jgi:RimJ/RimL family protein N-acetyltransferase
MVGLTNIDFVNGYAEISLIINPALHKMGFGRIAVTLALGEAFNNLRLDTVIGEVYECNPAIHFWRKIVKERDGYSTRLPRRKWHDGMLWDSMYFSFSVNDTPAEKL